MRVTYRRTWPSPCGRVAAYAAIMSPSRDIALARLKPLGTHPAVPGGAGKKISLPVTTSRTCSLLLDCRSSPASVPLMAGRYAPAAASAARGGGTIPPDLVRSTWLGG
jgi:hypothetical protein